ncbi:MAG TPA: hypothetical protein PLQ49_01580 [Methanothrix sp.]|nr:hypothetical protein [Methanothrix sp.]HRW82060.1 hypothetical protein [Methanothrix sp.]
MEQERLGDEMPKDGKGRKREERKTQRAKSQNIAASLKKTAASFARVFPVLIGVMLLISLILVLVPSSLYAKVFSGNEIFDPLIGAAIGSIAAGNPITSYIVGGELIDQGVSLLAVTAFIAAWVTVGVLQLPAEATILGNRFAMIRNGAAFLSAVLVAILTSVTLGLIWP